MHIKMSNLQLEGPWASCTLDYVQVHDGPNIAAPSMGKWCSTVKPPVLVSTGNTMTVRFYTDGSVNYIGFAAYYETGEMLNVVNTFIFIL
jgi:hypothetical protein